MDEKYNELMKYVISNYNHLSISEKINIFKDNGYDVTYDEIKKHKPNTNDAFDMLEKRVLDSLSLSNINNINDVLSNIKKPTIVSGVGGSFVVSTFASKVLEEKNNVIATNAILRDVNYMNLKPYSNLLVCSYGGSNHGVKKALECGLNKYLLSRNEIEGVNNIKYNVSDNELSFISLADTLIPMSILLQYYLDGDVNLIKEILSDKKVPVIKSGNVFEILSGIDTSTAHTFLESTFSESGIAIPIVHDKYDYCHGRSNLNYFNKNNNIIFFNNETELDNLYLNELKNYYENVYVINKKYEDSLVNDYYLTYKSMLLSKKLAEQKNMELSNIDYCPFVKKLYKYKGEM